jgi:hypothetical protein
MAAFLNKYDLTTQITEKGVNELFQDTSKQFSERLMFESIEDAVEEAAGYIRHRYNFDKTFATVNDFDIAQTYSVDSRVFWSEEDYDNTATYSIGDLAVYQEKIYEANQDILTPEQFDTAKWDFLAYNNTFYSVIQETTSNLPTETDYFSPGDTRNRKLKSCVVDIALYYAHARLTPRNIPENRRLMYDGDGQTNEGSALGWLKQVQKGVVTPDLQVIVDENGVTPQNTERISYGKTNTAKYKY